VPEAGRRLGLAQEALDALGAVKDQLGWILSTCPVSRLREPARAVELAKQAVALAPGESLYRLHLGVAYYRLPDYQACVGALENEMHNPAYQTAGPRFYLAMAQWRLGDRQAARRSYKQAVRATEAAKWPGTDLALIRAEAEEVLGPQGRP
jgi:tetratricopeptide (TPR) repeat protein